MKIDNKLISNLSKLAKLDFDKKTSLDMQEDLKKIIGFIDKLSEINTDKIEPLIYLSEELNVLRDDDEVKNLSQERALQNVPSKDSDYILVPKVLKR